MARPEYGSKERDSLWYCYVTDPKTSCVVDLCAASVPHGAIVAPGMRQPDASWALTWAREYLIFGMVTPFRGRDGRVLFFPDDSFPKTKTIRAAGSLARRTSGLCSPSPGHRLLGEELAAEMRSSIANCRLALAHWMQDEEMLGAGEWLAWEVPARMEDMRAWVRSLNMWPEG